MTFNYKKSLGQNFLKDKNIIDKIVENINPNSNDLIIEIGPGAGALTKRLVDKNCDVISFEIDKRLENQLNNIKSDNLKIVYEDFLNIDLKSYINSNYEHIYFVGNLPYYITTAIINKIISESKPYEIIIMIQKEVAQRFMAKPNTKEYNSLSIFLQYNFDITKIIDVNRNCFYPVPNVDSCVIKLKSKDKKYLKDEIFFYKLIKDAFCQKRKNLRNNLKQYDTSKIEFILKKYNKDLTYRAEQITLDEFIDISNNYN